MRNLLILAALTLMLALARAHAVDQPRPKYPEPSNPPIEAVNVQKKYVVVSGTVTVRARGLLVNPQEVTFVFQPEFPGSRGNLYRIGEGTYRMDVPRVPADAYHTVVIGAAYNDTIVKDDIVQRLGETYTGSLRIDIPNGRDYRFDDQLLDLR